jgi:exosortase
MPFKVATTFHQRKTQFLALLILLGLLFLAPLRSVIRLALNTDDYNYILLVPATSGMLLFLERRRIFGQIRHCASAGFPLVIIGLIGNGVHATMPPGLGGTALGTFSFLFSLMGVFVLVWGPEAFHRAAFPLLFLVLLIPPPPAVMNTAIARLQGGSASCSYWLFRLCRVPILQQGLSLILPGAEVQVARQCSGIRSSAALLIAGLLAGHLFLQSVSRKVLFAATLVPIMVLKNAVRIVIISLLGVYVDHSYFFGEFHHHYGGMAVSALAVALLLPIIWVLRKTEHPESHFGHLMNQPVTRTIPPQTVSPSARAGSGLR